MKACLALLFIILVVPHCSYKNTSPRTPDYFRVLLTISEAPNTFVREHIVTGKVKPGCIDTVADGTVIYHFFDYYYSFIIPYSDSVNNGHPDRNFALLSASRTDHADLLAYFKDHGFKQYAGLLQLFDKILLNTEYTRLKSQSSDIIYLDKAIYRFSGRKMECFKKHVYNDEYFNIIIISPGFPQECPLMELLY